jgi:hypothetical protein
MSDPPPAERFSGMRYVYARSEYPVSVVGLYVQKASARELSGVCQDRPGSSSGVPSEAWYSVSRSMTLLGCGCRSCPGSMILRGRWSWVVRFRVFKGTRRCRVLRRSRLLHDERQICSRSRSRSMILTCWLLWLMKLRQDCRLLPILLRR